MKYLTGLVLLAGLISSASANQIFTEDFEAEFPAWESGWLGTNTNLENVYGVGGDRGNNPDGLWISDGDAYPGYDDIVVISFENGFGSDISSLSIDIASWESSEFVVWDNNNTIISQVNVVPTNGTFTNPGTYQNLSFSSSSGISAFGFRYLSGQIEGNTSIDNVVVTKGTTSVPEPGMISLLGLSLFSLVFIRKNKQV